MKFIPKARIRITNERYRYVILKEEYEDGREMATRRLNRDQISEIARLNSSMNFICKRKNHIFNTLIDFEPVQIFENRSDE